MRNEFAKAVVELAKKNEKILFLTGDLGFNALEVVRDTLGNRFINAGVAEQNMVSVAAGLASKGFIPIVYSITPFVIIRPYEQIRNDVCFHDLPVILVGNGGGYGYGIMGSSHHAIQDIGLMRMLPNMKTIVPTFSTDIETALDFAVAAKSPCYMRLNSAIKSNLHFDPWRKLVDGNKAVAIGAGPVVSNLIDQCNKSFLGDFAIWTLGLFPFPSLPVELVEQIKVTKKIVLIEEHVQSGGLGEAIAVELLSLGISGLKVSFLNAKGYPSARYGSQAWHQNENSLIGQGLESALAHTLS